MVAGWTVVIVVAVVVLVGIADVAVGLLAVVERVASDAVAVELAGFVYLAVKACPRSMAPSQVRYHPYWR